MSARNGNCFSCRSGIRRVRQQSQLVTARRTTPDRTDRIRYSMGRRNEQGCGSYRRWRRSKSLPGMAMTLRCCRATRGASIARSQIYRRRMAYARWASQQTSRTQRLSTQRPRVSNRNSDRSTYGSTSRWLPSSRRYRNSPRGGSSAAPRSRTSDRCTARWRRWHACEPATEARSSMSGPHWATGQCRFSRFTAARSSPCVVSRTRCAPRSSMTG